MKTGNISIQQSDIKSNVTTNSSANSSNWNGHNIIVANSYQNKEDVKAGVGPGMFDGIGRDLVTISILFAATIASIAVAIATGGSLLSAIITFGVISFSALPANFYLSKINPTF